jgi:hypothetical protein
LRGFSWAGLFPGWQIFEHKNTHKMKRVYISGKITGLHIEVARELFNQGAATMKSLGHIPINPMELVPDDPNMTWEDYMRRDIKILLDCHAIYMLPNWTQSKGAQMEHDIAKKLRMEVFYHNHVKPEVSL